MNKFNFVILLLDFKKSFIKFCICKSDINKSILLFHFFRISDFTLQFVLNESKYFNLSNSSLVSDGGFNITTLCENLDFTRFSNNSITSTRDVKPIIHNGF